MKKLFIFITILASYTVYGQHTNPSGKILIGFNFSADNNYRTLSSHEDSSRANRIIKLRNDLERAKSGYTAGLHATFIFTKRTALEAGIQYSNKGYKTKNEALIYYQPDPVLPTNVRTNYAYHYIVIPVKARFTFGSTKLRFTTGAGFITSFLLSAKHTSTYQYADGRTEKKTYTLTTDFEKIDLTSMLSAGIDYGLTEKINVVAEPVFRYGLLSISEGYVTEKLWNVGINFGCHHRIK